MKRFFYSLFILAMFLPSFISSQTITGKLVDQNGNGLPGLTLQLYISPQVYNTTSGIDGSFTFNNVTDVKKEQLPTGYEVSNNYPNPFNPKTRIGITLPNSGSVRVDVYNLLGQRVSDEIERYFSTGTNFIDVELNGLTNGFYIARITLDEKYVVTKKLMLLYGSQHLSSSSGGLFTRLNKTIMEGNSILDTKIDSLVVTGISITKKVFTSLQNMVGSFLNLGNLIITLPVPNAPTLSSPTDGSTEISLSPTLYWNVSSTATSYTLQVSTSSSFSSFVFNQSGLTNTFQQISGLSNSTQYFWRVSATNSYGSSGWSNPWSFTTLGVPPSTPTLSSPVHDATEVSLSPILYWNVSSTAISYTLQVSTSDSFSSFVYNQSGLISTNQQITGLSNSTRYFWRVSATNSYGTSAFTTSWSFATVVTTPSAPTLTSPYNNATSISTSPTFTWNSSFGVRSYTLQVSTNSSFSSFVYNQSGLGDYIQRISGLNINTTYYWRVNGENRFGTSGWSIVWSFTTGDACQGTATITYAGKTYNTVQIGSQCWLKENLDIGTMINTSQNPSNNGTIEKYCYDNNPNNCTTYGGLYQWDEVMQYVTTPGTKGICPDGWHIPINQDFATLASAVIDNSYSLKIIGQDDASTNASGFSAWLAGYRYYNGNFLNLGNYAYFWSSTESNVNIALYLNLNRGGSGISFTYAEKDDGISVRCLKD